MGFPVFLTMVEQQLKENFQVDGQSRWVFLRGGGGAGLDTSRSKGHSFRIVAVCHTVMLKSANCPQIDTPYS